MRFLMLAMVLGCASFGCDDGATGATKLVEVAPDFDVADGFFLDAFIRDAAIVDATPIAEPFETPEAYFSHVTTLYCSRLRACCSAQRAPFETDAECADTLAPFYLGFISPAFDLQWATFDGAQARACADIVEQRVSTDCNIELGSLALELLCEQMTVGAQDIGEPCGRRDEVAQIWACAPFLECRKNENEDLPTCILPKRDGVDCLWFENDCLPESYCAQVDPVRGIAVCAPRIAIGERCGFEEECVADAECVDGVCTPDEPQTFCGD